MKYLRTPFNEFLSRSPSIALLAKSLLENKEQLRISSSKNDEIGFERYLKRIIRSTKISDAFRFWTQKFADVFNSGQNFVRNQKRPKFFAN